MLDVYKTVKDTGIAEIIIKKSRFIGHAEHTANEEEAGQFVERIRKQHAAASHNCWASSAGERDEFQKQSDDGEPSGTAGRPIMEVIKNKGLQNVTVVVTRYFGGIMLGAGGLVRAYTEAAAAGIEAAGPVYRVLHQEVNVSIGYTWLGKLEHELRNRKTTVLDQKFTDKVTLCCFHERAAADQFVKWMEDLTQGQGEISLGEIRYVSHISLNR